jgi:hypothetical protein
MAEPKVRDDLVEFLDEMIPALKGDAASRMAGLIVQWCKDTSLRRQDRIELVVGVLKKIGEPPKLAETIENKLVSLRLLAPVAPPAQKPPPPFGPARPDEPTNAPVQAQQSRPPGPRSSHSRTESPFSVVVKILDPLMPEEMDDVVPSLAAKIVPLCGDSRLSRAEFMGRLGKVFPTAPPPEFLATLAGRFEASGLIEPESQPAAPRPQPPRQDDAPRVNVPPPPAPVSNPASAPVKKDPPIARSGTVIESDTLLALPEMAITFTRGLVIQAWVRPDGLGDAPILELGDPADRSRIALLTTKDGAVRLVWCDTKGKVQEARSDTFLAVKAWKHVTAALGPDGVQFAVNGATVSTAQKPSGTLMPLSASRCSNHIGTGAERSDPRFVGAIADVRLWNRADALDRITASHDSLLRGDEAGLCGWWTLEGSKGNLDSGPFGRHARRSGSFKAGTATFEIEPLLDAWALDFVRGGGHVELSDIHVKERGFTWEASVYLRSPARTTLFSLDTSKGALKLVAARGKLSFEAPTTLSDRAVAAVDEVIGRALDILDGAAGSEEESSGSDRAGGTGESTGAKGLPQNQWAHVALTWSSSGTIRVLVNGAVVDTGSSSALRSGECSGVLGDDFDGKMAEVRVWSRDLTPGELVDLSKRRIHGWAKGLVGCWRMDDGSGSKTLLNAALGRATARIVGKAVVMADRGRLALAPAHKAPLPRSVRLEKKTLLKLPPLDMPDPHAKGLTVQMWIRPDTCGEATVLELPARSDDGSALVIQVDEAGGLTVTRRGKKTSDSAKKSKTSPSGATSISEFVTDLVEDAKRNVLASMDRIVTADDVFRARRWAHVSVTFDPDGLVCVYRNGLLVARDSLGVFRVASFTSGTLGSDEFAGMVSELRVWSRALSPREIATNWDRRALTGAGICGRWGLSADLSGKPGPVTGAALLCESPSLPILSPSEAASPTVDVTCSMLADQTQKGGKPQIVVDLVALDVGGRPLGGVDLTLVLDRDIPLYRSSVGSSRRLDAIAGEESTYRVTTGSQGRARVAFEAKELLAPLFRIRHPGMRPGEWVIVAPDTVIQQALVSLTDSELRSGRCASPSTKAGSKGFVAEDAEELGKVLRGMAKTSANFTLEVDTGGAMSFGDDEAPASTPLQPVEGSIFVVPEQGTLVRRLARRPSEEPALAESFGFLDWLEDTFDTVVDWVEDTGEEAIDTIETVVDDVIGGIKMGVETVIDGVKIAFEWTIETIEDVAAAVGEVLAKLKKTVVELLAFVAALFDWDDIRETAEFTLTTLKKGLSGAKSGIEGVFDTIESGIRSAEETILGALGGSSSSFAKKASGATSQRMADWTPMTSPLEFLISLLPDDLESAMRPVLAVFEPITNVLTNAISRITTLGRDLGKEWQSGELQKALECPEKFVDADPGEWFNLARLLVRAVTGSVLLAIGVVRDLLSGVLTVIGNLLDLRIDIPVLTDFVEDHVLGGKDLTIGRLLSLVVAIPTTLAHKLVNGSSEGPCAQLDSPASFGVDTEEDRGTRVADIVMRSVHLAMGIFLSSADIYDTASKGDGNKVISAVAFATNSVSALADAYFVFADPFVTQDVQHGTDLAKAAVAFDMTSWTLGAAGLVADAVGLIKSSTQEVAGQVSGWLGVASGAAAFVKGVLDCVDTFVDDSHTAGAGTVVVLDTASTLAGVAAGVASALPIEDGAGKAVRVVVVAAGHAIELSTSFASLVVRSTTDQGA